MNKEKLSKTISLLMQQNLCVVNKGTKEKPDFVVGGADLLNKELTKLFSLYGVVASLPSRLEMNNQAGKEFEKMELINKTIPFKHFRLGFSTCYNWMLFILNNKG
jgi:hypothetical protein